MKKWFTDAVGKVSKSFHGKPAPFWDSWRYMDALRSTHFSKREMLKLKLGREPNDKEDAQALLDALRELVDSLQAFIADWDDNVPKPTPPLPETVPVRVEVPAAAVADELEKKAEEVNAYTPLPLPSDHDGKKWDAPGMTPPASPDDVKAATEDEEGIVLQLSEDQPTGGGPLDGTAKVEEEKKS